MCSTFVLREYLVKYLSNIPNIAMFVLCQNLKRRTDFFFLRDLIFKKSQKKIFFFEGLYFQEISKKELNNFFFLLYFEEELAISFVPGWTGARLSSSEVQKFFGQSFRNSDHKNRQPQGGNGRRRDQTRSHEG